MTRLAYSPEDAARSLEPQPHGLAWVDPDGFSHYRDQHGQISHHKPGPDCGCGTTKESK